MNKVILKELIPVSKKKKNPKFNIKKSIAFIHLK